jgi:hypothetical protein
MHAACIIFCSVYSVISACKVVGDKTIVGSNVHPFSPCTFSLMIYKCSS